MATTYDDALPKHHKVTGTEKRVILASSLGTVFEWYDFFVYGALAALLGSLFFPAGNETAGFLLSLATFGAGFVVRPFGALVFGALGDRMRRTILIAFGIFVWSAATCASVSSSTCRPGSSACHSAVSLNRPRPMWIG